MNIKNHFVCLLNESSKNNFKTAHWVGHSQLRYLHTYIFFKRTPFVDEKQASVTGNTIKQSVAGGGENLYLLQEAEENISEEANDDADIK